MWHKFISNNVEYLVWLTGTFRENCVSIYGVFTFLEFILWRNQISAFIFIWSRIFKCSDILPFANMLFSSFRYSNAFVMWKMLPSLQKPFNKFSGFNLFVAALTTDLQFPIVYPSLLGRLSSVIGFSIHVSSLQVSSAIVSLILMVFKICIHHVQWTVLYCLHPQWNHNYSVKTQNKFVPRCLPLKCWF